MQPDDVVALFDQQAENYDTQWTNLFPITNGLYFLLNSVFKPLPADATLLCVGAGTGREICYLANQFPQWRFTLVEPSHNMLSVCQATLKKLGLESRCEYHCGYIETLARTTQYDAATSILVSHFITDQQVRTNYFRHIASHLTPNGVLVNADLCADQSSALYNQELTLWFNTVARSGNPELSFEKLKLMYANDVALLPSRVVSSIINKAGFNTPIKFFQSGLIHAFCADQMAGNTHHH
ncbi:SAM-dependent methyltransferase [Arenicella chitinivorans]|uniref:SAM-dependent methyltransferase n=1 Tax=Arenicella chitinivorans TaxID=1329800 RepID=A0A918RL12_9GAMM|nr:class I SAM-dependent methyltransferase [Arenicella chitinivorans]GHA00545.1 SAM-dependent methyltransferase [Arenicella chitinivorans]